jgi:hypothetical protein
MLRGWCGNRAHNYATLFSGFLVTGEAMYSSGIGVRFSNAILSRDPAYVRRFN